jgi:hypothetical protein
MNGDCQIDSVLLGIVKSVDGMANCNEILIGSMVFDCESIGEPYGYQ